MTDVNLEGTSSGFYQSTVPSFSAVGYENQYVNFQQPEYAQPQQQPQKCNIIYVYGIGEYATESDLYSLFSKFGPIQRVNVIKNSKTGKCKGYGFVEFETFEKTCEAVEKMNGYRYHHKNLQVSLKFSNQHNISSSSI